MLVHGASGVAASMSLFKKPPVDVGKTIQIVVDHQPPAIHDAGRRQVAVQDAGRSHRGDEGQGRQGELRHRLLRSAPSSARSTRHGTGIKAVEVVYKNAIDSLNDQLSGAVDYAVHDPVYALAQQREGRLRILAVSTAERLKANPDMPTMKELGVSNFNMMGWWAAMVPAGTPRTGDRPDQQMV